MCKYDYNIYMRILSNTHTEENAKKAIAIFGGSFDPIHLGHLHLAELVREEFSLDEVIFIPSGLPPHKKLYAAGSNEFRFEMVRLATASNPYFTASRLEIDRGGYSYTVDTLNEIRGELSANAALYFIIGADALVEMHKWKTPEKLFSLCEIIAIERSGVSDGKVAAAINTLKNKYGAKIHLLKKQTYPISSTKIRERLQHSLSIKYLVSAEVFEYITKHGLYSGNAAVKAVDEYLCQSLSCERYAHSLRVAEAAVHLAKIHSIDSSAAYLAALLHDIAKELPTEKMYKYVKADDEIFLYPPVAHSFIGAYVAEEVFDIKDSDILNSIRYHTTGRSFMSALEKIIFIADKIEEGREYTELPYLKSLAELDLDKALFAILQITASVNTDKGKKIHPLSLEALKTYKTN